MREKSGSQATLIMHICRKPPQLCKHDTAQPGHFFEYEDRFVPRGIGPREQTLWADHSAQLMRTGTGPPPPPPEGPDPESKFCAQHSSATHHTYGNRSLLPWTGPLEQILQLCRITPACSPRPTTMHVVCFRRLRPFRSIPNRQSVDPVEVQISYFDNSFPYSIA